MPLGSLLGYSGVHAICKAHLHHKQGCLNSVYTLSMCGQTPIFSLCFPILLHNHNHTTNLNI